MKTRPYATVGVEPPEQARARERTADVECVDMVIPRAEVEGAVDEQRRRLDRARVVAPEDPPAHRAAALVADAHRDDEAALGARVAMTGPRLHVRLVDDAVRDRRRGGGAMPEVLPPATVSGRGADGEE